MQQVSPRILKQRQDKYEKLIRMIRGFQRTGEELKLLDKIKSDTIFQISLRFRRCQANKTYKFPKKEESSYDSDVSEDEQELICDKELVYNLHTQNKHKNDISHERSRLKLPEASQHLSKRQKTEASSSTRVSSLGIERSRHSRQRIDRIEKLHHWAVERERQKTERASEKRVKQSLEKVTTKTPAHMYTLGIFSKTLVSSEASSQNHSNHLSQVKPFMMPTRRDVCKTEVSPTKIDRDRSRPRIKLVTQETEIVTTKKPSQKKLHTEESGQTIKKGRIHNFLTNEIKKAEKANLLVNFTQNSKLRPKNLFQKQVY